MAGLLAWAADVVRAGGEETSDEDNKNSPSFPPIFTREQLVYVQELDRKTASLKRSIRDLRLRLPPPDISQSLPDLHARSVASSNALSLQLNAHSATKQELHAREERLLEENAEYQSAVSNCEDKIEERLREAESLQNKLKELELIEKNLKSELLVAQSSMAGSESSKPGKEEAELELIEKLENKKSEMASTEKTVQEMEMKWQQIQELALKQPSPAQREKALDKQLHSLIEQLASKQAQAEGLSNGIRVHEMELEKLNGMWTSIQSNSSVSSSDLYNTRNRFARSNEPVSDYGHNLPVHVGGKGGQGLQKLMVLRSAFVLYILLLHMLVFIKISL
ncbi:hypothetical protein M569_03030 [Genlisea aurea]|uniref:Uncharacterized protein n=1 Tax=Genlisea aurea TaxID=192259 RepID=S8CWD7_9LAMI|nr:hypothetical protein M569_03030 [Genlisea aurea]